jgi:hypothetical protein
VSPKSPTPPPRAHAWSCCSSRAAAPSASFTSAKDAWHHAGEAAYQQLAAAQVFRGTFALRPGSVEHTGDFTAMAESFRKGPQV